MVLGWDSTLNVSSGIPSYHQSQTQTKTYTDAHGGGRVVRRCWVNFQCRGVLLIWIIVGQGPTVLAVGAGGGCLAIFSPIYHFSFLSPSLWETARYRLKYRLKGPLAPKQSINQLTRTHEYWHVPTTLSFTGVPYNSEYILHILIRQSDLGLDIFLNHTND